MGRASVIETEIQAVIQQPRQNYEWTLNRYLQTYIHCQNAVTALNMESPFQMSPLLFLSRVSIVSVTDTSVHAYPVLLRLWSSPSRLVVKWITE